MENAREGGAPQKARGSVATNKPGPQLADGRHVPRRARAYSYSTRNTLFHRVDTWLYTWFPTTLRSSFPTLALLYCFLSVWFFSGYIRSGYFSRSPAPHIPQQELTALERLPLDHLLSKVSSLRPLTLDPNVLGPLMGHSTFCACVWATEAELDLVIPWADRWTGPISLLVTTTYAPGSRQHKNLMSILANVQGKSNLLRKSLSAHILHLDPSTDHRPNAFLNLARLLSPCPRVVLFPGNLSYVPPKSLYKTLVALQTSSSSAMAGRIRKRKPVVLTVRDYASFPFAPLAPLAISRDDSTWCTERFFANVSRSADWEECLWQVWLANFGDVEVKQLHGWTPALPVPDRSSGLATDNSTKEKIHRRLSAKFRGETCALAVRRLTSLLHSGGNTETKKTRWLKRVCRGWSSA